jgi:hypothetical protein
MGNPLRDLYDKILSGEPDEDEPDEEICDHADWSPDGEGRSEHDVHCNTPGCPARGYVVTFVSDSHDTPTWDKPNG